MRAKMRGWSRFVAYQGEYSLASLAPERDRMPMSSAWEMTRLAWGVFGGRRIDSQIQYPIRQVTG
jgi:aryl-alcohol dehydrogenase-like predicted oxidoreductase